MAGISRSSSGFSSRLWVASTCSEKHPKGILLETYCAIIACLLINVSTGRRPTQRTYGMLCDYVLGLASLEEVTAHLAKREAVEAAKKKA
jgi:hypothetical protein